MIRVALISDSHFDRTSRWEETIRIHRWIAEDVAQREVDAVLLGGDLFERRPQPEETAGAAEWLRELAAVAPVVGVYGNHDAPRSLDAFTHLGVDRTDHPITFYDRPAVHVVESARRRDEVAIACLPWPRKAAVLAALGRPVAHEEAGQVAADALRAVLMGLGQQLEECRLPNRLFLGHVMVRGSRVSTGQPLVGADFEVGLEDLGLVRASAYLLGHIHLGQEWQWNDAPLIYPGSPRRKTFGETEAKRYAIVTIDGGRLDVDYVETPATPMLLGEDQWGTDGAGRDGWLVGWHDLDPEHARGAEVRLRYRVAADKRDAARRAAEETRRDLVERGALLVQLEEEVIPTARARAPEIAAATTLEEQLRALWAAKGIRVGDDRAARVFGLLRQAESEAA